MPEVAIADGQSKVKCSDGTQGTLCSTSPDMWHWDKEYDGESDKGSESVFCEGYGVVREQDTMKEHPYGTPCTPTPIPHTPYLNTFEGTPTVYAEGKLIGRVNDKYNSEDFDHEIVTGATSILIG